jgi:RND family efflux transporter MFP subunit
MNKQVAGSALAAVVVLGLYVAGMPPFTKPDAGHAAQREVGQPAPKAAQREEPAPAVTVVRAAMAPLTDTVLVTGTLVPRLEVLVAPEVEGLRVVELLVEEGDRVTKGQVLARLEQETLKVQLAQNEATLARASAAIAQAQSNIAAAEARRVEASNAFDRARPLRQSGTVSESTLDQREAAFRTAVAQLKAAQDGLKLAEAEKAQVEAQRRDVAWRLSRTEVRAPVDGIVSRRNARIGGLGSGAAVAQPMFNLIADGQIELEAEVPEADLAKLKAGQAATVTVAGAGEVKGTVRLVMPEVDKATRQGRLRIGLGDAPGLHIGSFGRGAVVLRSATALVVPTSAVLFNAEGAYVQIVSGNRVVSRKVVAGLQTGEVIEIRGGLAEGEAVVARSGTFLRAGDAITPVEGRDSAKKTN